RERIADVDPAQRRAGERDAAHERGDSIAERDGASQEDAAAIQLIYAARRRSIWRLAARSCAASRRRINLIPIGKIGFGGMPLSIQGRPPEEQGRRVIQAVIDAGVDFIDTADVYCLDDDDIGHNERLIASAATDSVHIGTKAGLRRPRGAWT